MGWASRWGLVRDAASGPSVHPGTDLVRFAEQPVVLPALTDDPAQVRELPTTVATAFGINTATDRVNRDQAMSVPSVRRGREVICGTIGSAELVAVTATGQHVHRPLLVSPNPNLTRSHVLTWTLDDLLFHGASWWHTVARDAAGYPLAVERIVNTRVRLDAHTGAVRIDGKPVPDADLIRFDSNGQGILAHGGRTLRTAILLEEAVRKFARLDVPLGYITDSEGSMEDEEIQEFLDEWEVARAKRTTGYLPSGMDYKAAALDAQKIELGAARDHQAADVARLLNLPPSAVNAPSGDSLTYATTESNRRELVDLTLRPFLTTVEQRLSMPDVTPPGITVTLDLTRFLLGDTTSLITAGAAAVSAGLMTADEVRTRWLGLPPLPANGAITR